MKALRACCAVLLLAAAVPACRSFQPIIGKDEDQTTPGTIGGVLTAVGGEALAGRRVYAVEASTARRYSAVTNVAGGFSIPVPPGQYRLTVDLAEGEKVVRDPGLIDINESDLDANLEIVIGS
ncbi:MAG TPA: carboxypeptidase-like regulatory domain-containing protein [Vicinamibacteria bacterium]|nr:carboxypeptidase-like regulatory domain-containing protein [Vicinamibacteria bacterium]